MLVCISTLFLLCGCFHVVSGDCGKHSGPSGTTACVSFARYNNVPQWSTCLTDLYIKVKSDESHHCRDSTATFCWYQCMCELNNECNGPDVYRNCSCDPQSSSTIAPQTLPPWCFSPDGKSCSWYQDCLEKRHPCEGTGAAYAITFAQTFCDLYSEHKVSFSEYGQRWIDAVRKCLQVELVPVLRPWISATCDEIKDLAFASHPKCYASPASGVSYCSLGIEDRWKIFWTIKSSFVSSAFLDSVKGLFELTYTCAVKTVGEIKEGLRHGMNMIKIFVKDAIDLWKVYGKVVDAIADIQDWKKNGIDWFWLNRNTRFKRETSLVNTHSDNSIEIVLASRSLYNLNAINARYANVTEIVMELADSLQKGFPSLTIDGVQVDIQSMAACSDLVCNSTYLDVKANIVYPKINGQVSRVSILSPILMGLASVGFRFITTH